MSRTYRDIRRAKYRQFVVRWFPVVELNERMVGRFDLYHSQYPRDLLVEQQGLEHICSRYCLCKWAKRVDRRKVRLRGKRWLRENALRLDDIQLFGISE